MHGWIPDSILNFSAASLKPSATGEMYFFSCKQKVNLFFGGLCLFLSGLENRLTAGKPWDLKAYLHET